MYPDLQRNGGGRSFCRTRLRRGFPAFVNREKITKYQGSLGARTGKSASVAILAKLRHAKFLQPVVIGVLVGVSAQSNVSAWPLARVCS